MNHTDQAFVGYNHEPMNVTSGDEVIFQHNWEVLFNMPLVIFGVAGNILVSMAVTMEKRLQSVTNYFLLSLAITDLLVCMVVWPFSILNGFFGYWPLNVALCNLYITFDVLLCTSSILHLCTISLERFIAIRSPLASRTRSKTAVRIKILLVYLTALAISSPIMILGIVDQKNILQDNHCVLMNNHFIIYGSVSAFYIPLVIMGIIFGLTVQQLRAKWKLCDPKHQSKDGEIIMRRFKSNRKSKSFKKCLKALEKEQGHRKGLNKPVAYMDQTPTLSETAIEQLDQIKPLFYKDSCDNSECNSFKSESPESNTSGLTFPDVGQVQGSSHDNRIHFSDLRDQSIPEDDTFEISRVTRSMSDENPSRSTQDDDLGIEKLNDMNDNETIHTGVTKTFSAPSRLHELVRKHAHGSARSSTSLMSKKDSMKQKHVKNCVRTEQKASKTLGIIFASFVVCWAPFFIVNILSAICDNCKFDHLMVAIFEWLGYFSSTLNPIIYTVFNRTFRTTIVKLMKCQYKNVQKSMRIKAICIGLNYQVPKRKNTKIQIPL